MIDIKLENWDKLKAATISDMPTYHDTEHGDKIGEIVASREELEEDRKRIELDIAELNEWVIDIDSKLQLMKYIDRWLLTKKYIDNMPIKVITNIYNKKIGISERQTVYNRINCAEKLFNELK